MDSVELQLLQSSKEIVELLDSKIPAFERLAPLNVVGVDAFINAVGHWTGISSYRRLPAVCHALTDAAVLKGGVQGGQAFLALAIAKGMKATLTGNVLHNLPRRVWLSQIKHYRWMAQSLTGTEPWLQVGHDIFQKEFGVAVAHLYVCGSQVVEFRSGLPRSLLFKEGLSQALSGAAYFARIGGFRPFLQIHMHDHLRAHFNEAGRRECYLCCADLYSAHPELLGMFGGSWFYDPVVATISPRLAFLQKEPLQGGARLFRWGPSHIARHEALLTSSTRRDLEASGEYQPCSYFMVWDRAAQMRWAANVGR